VGFGGQLAGMVKVVFKSGWLLFALAMFAFLVSNLNNSHEHQDFRWTGKDYASHTVKFADRTMSTRMSETVKAEYEAAQEAYFDSNNFSFYERNKNGTLDLIIVLGFPSLGWKIKKWLEEANKNMIY
jgi:hypothetical protein